MSITQSGNTLTWDGTVTITNATDITTGVATLMLTPNGGVGILPALAQGEAGQPALFDSASVTTLSAGSSATVTLTPVSTGGSGLPSHYTLAFGIPVGATGASGTMAIGSASDLESTFGSSQDQYMIKWQNADGKFKAAAQAVGPTLNATSFTAASGNTSPQTLATVTVPSQPFNWVPRVTGQASPTGTANTHVDLRCLLNNATSGQQVGYGTGITGAGSGSIPAISVGLMQAFGGALSGGYGVVSAGSAATFYFQCVQTAATTDSFSVPTTNMYFSVKVDPVPGTN